MSRPSPVSDVGDEIPDFTLDSQLGQISLHDMIDGKWCLVLTFDRGFEPVGTTDIGMIGKMIDEFEARNILLIAVGRDSVPNYRKWIKDIEELQTTKITFPIVSDPDMIFLSAMGCTRKTLAGDIKVVASGLFLVDIDRRIRSSFRYSLSTGRNFYEVLRLFDALHVVTYHRVVCPSNWAVGQEVMIHPDVQEDEAALFRFAEIKPWFRLTNVSDL